MKFHQLPTDARNLIATGHDNMLTAANLALPGRAPEAVAEWDRARDLFNQACSLFDVDPVEALRHL